MFFVIGDRNTLIELFPKNARWAEVGIYRGDFSQRIYDMAKPWELYLIDNWRFDVADHDRFRDYAENFAGFSGKIHWQHFGDDPNYFGRNVAGHIIKFWTFSSACAFLTKNFREDQTRPRGIRL